MHGGRRHTRYRRNREAPHLAVIRSHRRDDGVAVTLVAAHPAAEIEYTLRSGVKVRARAG